MLQACSAASSVKGTTSSLSTAWNVHVEAVTERTRRKRTFMCVWQDERTGTSLQLWLWDLVWTHITHQFHQQIKAFQRDMNASTGQRLAFSTDSKAKRDVCVRVCASVCSLHFECLVWAAQETWSFYFLTERCSEVICRSCWQTKCIYRFLFSLLIFYKQTFLINQII